MKLGENEEEYFKAREDALRLLKFRMRSIWEIRDRLKRKGWDYPIINRVVEEFSMNGILDDEKFIQSRISSKVRMKHVGPKVLRYDLTKFGVDRHQAEDAIRNFMTPSKERETIMELLRSKRIDPGKISDAKEKKKNFAMLMRKGFSWDLIYSVFSEPELLEKTIE